MDVSDDMDATNQWGRKGHVLEKKLKDVESGLDRLPPLTRTCL